MANKYKEVSNKKLSYLNSVDNLILKNAPDTINNYLDIGGGDGIRTKKIADNLNPKYTMLIDNSEEMVKLAKERGLNEVCCESILDLSNTFTLTL